MSISNGLVLPNQISNGNALDATVVMANYNALLAALNRALLDAGGGSGMTYPNLAWAIAATSGYASAVSWR